MKRYGFTLVELMVVIFIFSIIMAATFGVLSMGRQSWHTGSTQVELQQETRRAMDSMVKELRESSPSKINITGGGTIITFQVPINDNPDWGAEGSLGWSIEYSLSIGSGQILRKILDNTGVEQASLKRILANNINTLSFTSVSSSEISIGITAQKDAIPGRTMQSTLNSQVTLRNK